MKARLLEVERQVTAHVPVDELWRGVGGLDVRHDDRSRRVDGGDTPAGAVRDRKPCPSADEGRNEQPNNDAERHLNKVGS